MDNNVDDFNLEDDEYGDETEYTIDDALDMLPLPPDTRIVPGQVLIGFSDMLENDLERASRVWETLPVAQRLQIMERMGEMSEADFMLDYTVAARMGLHDPDGAVRTAAINASWTDDSIPALHFFAKVVREDPFQNARAAAIEQIGRFIFLGEIEEIPQDETQPMEELLLEIYQNRQEPVEVRGRALEAFAHSSREEVNILIQRAYDDPDTLMQVSAVRAMGNSYDNVWKDTILELLESTINEMRFEAARAAGALGLTEAVALLGELGYDEDRLVQIEAVCALGEIGGKAAIEALNNIDLYAQEQEDEDLADAVEEALDAAEIVGTMDGEFDMLWLPDDDDLDDEAT